MSESARRKGHDAIRDAAWQGASASGLSSGPFGNPPLSSVAYQTVDAYQWGPKESEINTWFTQNIAR